MIYARRFTGVAPPGSVVVRLVDADGAVMGFVRQLDDRDDGEIIHPSEMKPVEEVLRLAESKQQDAPGSVVFVELEAGLDWNEGWGKLES